MIDRFVTHAARHAPFAPAIRTLHGDVTFGRFEHEVSLTASWVSKLKLDPARPVVVCCSEKYLHWLLLLAFARCDIATASISGLTPPGVVEAITPQLFLSDQDLPDQTGAAQTPVQRLDPDFVRELLSSTQGGFRRSHSADPERLVRISTSSGTTGAPKRIGLSGALVEQRMIDLLRLAPEGMMRFMPLVGPESGGFEACLSAWAVGGSVVFAPRSLGELAEALPRLQPQALAGAPVQLQHLLAALPSRAPPISGMRLTLFGAHAPMSLRAELTSRLTADVNNAYGSTECGLIAGASVVHLPDASCTGFVHPWAKAEIVDDSLLPTPIGELGRLRIRSPDAVDHYTDDDNATAKHFRDGWFYPGDLGSLSSDGMLRLEGRSDDVINAGGEKMLPLRLEEAALSCAGVVDAAGFMAPGKSGVDAAWIAVVAGADLDRANLARSFAALGAPEVNIAWVKTVPRNERGKIKRDELRRALVGSIETSEQRRAT